MKFLRPIVLLVFICCTLSATAQYNVLSKVLEKFTLRETNHPSSTLFLHCDKTLYTNNEIIWFAAYLQANRGTPIQKHHTLSVALLNNERRRVEVSELYVMEAGLASGSLLLPDTIAPGNYHLLAYTNIVDKNGVPFEVFSIPLTIKSTLETKFSASIKLLDTAQDFKGARRLSIRASGIPMQKNGKYPPVSISYYTADGEVKSTQTNEEGEVMVRIDPRTLNPHNNSLHATVSYGKEIKYLSLSLPIANLKGMNINFYPEGGNLSNGIVSTVGFEARSAYGQPLNIRAILLKDGKPIDTVETSISGMGSFKLLPSIGSKYLLKAFTSNLLAKDSVYTLPLISETLPVISMSRAVTRDTLSFTLKNSIPKTFDILIHNTHELLASFRIEAHARGRSVKIALKDVPKGIASVTVLDTLGRPLAERLFFAHYTDGELLNAVPDKPVYKPREKVTLKLRLKETEEGKEETALVSVAAVQGNRIEAAKFRDMESYTYLEHELGTLPLNAMGIPSRDKQYLENLLLVKGWRRFVLEEDKWPERIDTVGMYRSLEFSGKVMENGKELNEPVSINLIRDTLIGRINTQSNGSFELSADEMIIPAGKKLMFMINKQNKDQFKIGFENPFEKVNKQFSKQHLVTDIAMGRTESNSSAQYYKVNDKAIQLKVVEIKGRTDDLLTGTKINYTPTNLCGDWVCAFGTLNCPLVGHYAGSDGSNLPVKGKQYTWVTLMNGKVSIRTTNYVGCIYEVASKSNLFSMQGRQISKEFYINDYNIDPELSYQSTVYWLPFLQLNSSKDTEVSFYTSDLKAPYKVIIQGVSEKQVVAGTTNFNVE